MPSQPETPATRPLVSLPTCTMVTSTPAATKPSSASVVNCSTASAFAAVSSAAQAFGDCCFAGSAQKSL